jgi:predicted kinase
VSRVTASVHSARSDSRTAVIPATVVGDRLDEWSARRIHGRESVPLNGILIVIGVPCAGKTTIGQWLASNRGFRHLESSSILPVAAQEHGYTHPDKAALARSLFKAAGYDAVEAFAVNNGLIPAGGSTVYTGVRTVEGVAALHDYARTAGKACYIVHVDVPIRQAIVRSIDRARAGQISPASYRIVLEQDRQFGALQYAKVMADWQITNSTSLDSLVHRVDSMLVSLAAGRLRRETRIRPVLVAAGPTGGHPDAPTDPEWLGSHHPKLIHEGELTPRGAALYRILGSPAEASDDSRLRRSTRSPKRNKDEISRRPDSTEANRWTRGPSCADDGITRY